MRSSKGYPTFSHSFPAGNIYRYANHHLLTDRTMSKVGSNFDPESLSWHGERFQDSVLEFERQTYDRRSGSINWSIKTVPQIKNYLNDTNNYLEEETRDTSHAQNIREQISQIDRASKTALTDLDVVRRDMWQGYHFDKNTVGQSGDLR
jgi:hypothetical protein